MDLIWKPQLAHAWISHQDGDPNSTQKRFNYRDMAMFELSPIEILLGEDEGPGKRTKDAGG